MKHLLPVCLLFSAIGTAQTLNVQPVDNAVTAITETLFGGCITPANVTYTGKPLSIGTFESDIFDNGFNSGLIISTGNAHDAMGPNNLTEFGSGFFIAGDENLSQLAGAATTYDASIIEFDFTAETDTMIAAEFVFGSDDYPEYTNSETRDVFGIFIGPADLLSPAINIARVPGSSLPVSVATINSVQRTELFVDNGNGNSSGQYGQAIQFDGFTKPIRIGYAVVAGQTYHVKIAIADVGNAFINSGLFLKTGSFHGQMPASTCSSAVTDMSVQFGDDSPEGTVFSWDFGDGYASDLQNPAHTYSEAGTFTVTLNTVNNCGENSSSFTVDIVLSGITETKLKGVALLPVGNGNYRFDYALSSPESLDILVMNAAGQTVMTRTVSGALVGNEMINLEGFASGIYVVRVVGGGKGFWGKVVR